MWYEVAKPEAEGQFISALKGRERPIKRPPEEAVLLHLKKQEVAFLHL
jgi:hypothetical protein